MKASLVAWDIDKTLIDAGASGGRIMDDAIAAVLATEVAHTVRFGGKTDPLIAGEILTAVGVPAPHGDHVTDVLVELERVLAERAHVMKDEGRVLPGVREAMTGLRDAGVTQTVLTGNIRPNAAVKLATFGLDEYVDLDVGAYGSDHADRPRLLPLLLDRAERAYGRRWAPEEVWVVGDTEHDHACAAASGARCMLVATGGTSFEDLSALGADVVLPDLSDTETVLAHLTA